MLIEGGLKDCLWFKYYLNNQRFLLPLTVDVLFVSALQLPPGEYKFRIPRDWGSVQSTSGLQGR